LWRVRIQILKIIRPEEELYREIAVFIELDCKSDAIQDALRLKNNSGASKKDRRVDCVNENREVGWQTTLKANPVSNLG
jgi:hypothetical protein